MSSLVQLESNGGQLAPLSNAGDTAQLMRTLVMLPARVARRWWIRHQARQQMLELDDHLLTDIGMTRGNAVLEWQKGFWEA